MVLPLSLFCVENRVCLSHSLQVAGAAWWATIRIMAGVGDLGQRTRDGQAQVRYLVAGQLRGQMTLCSVCTVHDETRSAGFLVWPQNQGRQFVSGLATKPLGWFVSGLASKLLGWFVIGLVSKALGRFVKKRTFLPSNFVCPKDYFFLSILSSYYTNSINDHQAVLIRRTLALCLA
jgi:hypothetical protein